MMTFRLDLSTATLAVTQCSEAVRVSVTGVDVYLCVCVVISVF